MPHRARLPISSRHAFALAFDMAFRRDLVHSILVPLALQAPWFVTLALVPPLTRNRDRLFEYTLLTALALIGQWVTWHLVAAMLRFRARSVFNTPASAHPGEVAGHYRAALGRLVPLLGTELVRTFSSWLSSLFLVVPVLYIGFKFSMATEAVVLRPKGFFGSFRRSFELTEGRFERWLEMIVISVVLALGVWFTAALLYVGVPGPGPDPYAKAAYILLFVFVLPLVQYAWTFFYLRLEEIDPPAVAVDEGKAAEPAILGAAAWRDRGAQPQLRLVELKPDPAEDERES